MQYAPTCGNGIQDFVLFEEEHFLVGGEWPEVVSDDAFEGIGLVSDVVHLGDDFVAEESCFLLWVFVVVLEEKVEVFESGIEFVGVFDGFIEELFGGGFVELFEGEASLCDLSLEAVGSGEDLGASHFEHQSGFNE